MCKICLVVPYFGKLPSTYRPWLRGLELNPTVDVLLVTNTDAGIVPTNVHVMSISFDELIARFQAPFDFPIELTSPYRICDYRPAFGVIFADELKDYDFWGNCDMDQVFGDIRGFITDEVLSQYELINYLGHFTLYKNCARINNMFMLENGVFSYREVFTSKTKRTFSFGECMGTLGASLEKGYKRWVSHCYLDMNTSIAYRLKPPHYVADYIYQTYYWEDGHVYHAFVKDDVVSQNEYMYIHFQKRRMANEISDVAHCDRFYICANNYIEKENHGVPSAEDIIQLSPYKGVVYERYLHFVAKIKKLTNLVTLSKDERRIVLLQWKWQPHFHKIMEMVAQNVSNSDKIKSRINMNVS